MALDLVPPKCELVVILQLLPHTKVPRRVNHNVLIKRTLANFENLGEAVGLRRGRERWGRVD